MNKHTDQYGLRGKIHVILTEDSMGNITISPTSRAVEKQVAESNDYDHHGTLFIQEARWEEWTDTLPKKAFYGRGKARGFNDGVRFMMDSWDFRHLVGGQSD